MADGLPGAGSSDNSKRCYPLTVLVDHSHFNISLEAREETEAVVTPLFAEGLPPLRRPATPDTLRPR